MQMEPGEKWKSFPWVSFCNPEKFYVIVETRGSVASSSRALSLWKPLHFLFDFFLWGGCPTAYGILVPCPGIEPTPPGLGAWTLNHWTPREVLHCISWDELPPPQDPWVLPALLLPPSTFPWPQSTRARKMQPGLVLLEVWNLVTV